MMSGGKLRCDFGKIAGATACGAILLAGLAAGSYRHRATQSYAATAPAATLATSVRTTQRSFLPAPRAHPVSHSPKLNVPRRQVVPELRAVGVDSPASSPGSSVQAMQMYAALPMSFETNNGQADPRVKFLAHAPGYTLLLTDQEAVLSLPAGSPAPASAHQRADAPVSGHRQTSGATKPARVVRLKFVGAATPSAIAGRDQLPSKTNYFIGNDSKQWHTNVPNYSAVEYRGIYSGVDAVFHGDNRRLEFDFNIAPGADPHAIALEVDGARRIRLNRAGDVLLGMDGTQDVVMGKPHIYQQSPAGRREIAGHYVLSARNRIAFALDPYDHAQPLVIDPTITYSTYLGGGISQESNINAIAVDSSGDAYVTGTFSADTVPFPTIPGSYNTGPAPAYGSFSFISKLKTDGSGLVYSTYFGGVNASGFGGDQIFAIAVDSTGAAYFGGTSASEDNTPTTPGSFMPIRPSLYVVAFVAKLSADGSMLVYSTYLDGSPNSDGDNVGGIAVDSLGSAYVTGVTTATNFPTKPGAFQTVYKASIDLGTAFVTKLSADGSSLVYSTFLGGSTGENDVSQIGGTAGEGAIAVDSLGFAYVTGFTQSTDFPTTTGAYSTTCGSPCQDVFATKVNADGTGLVYSTFLGGGGAGNKYSVGRSIAVDSAGSAFVGGTTNTPTFPVTSGALQTSPGVGFITKLKADGTSQVYSSYFGGYVMSVAVGSDDSAVLFGFSNTGYTFESTPDAFTIPGCPSTAGCFYGFISKLTADGSALIFSSPIGGDAECCTIAGALDPAGDAYITGSTSSQDLYTTPGSFEPSLPSTYTGFTPFVAKVAFSSSTPLTLSPTTLPSGTAGVAYSQAITATGGTGAVTFAVTAGSPPSGFTLTPAGDLSGTATQTGTSSFTVTATDSTNDTGSQAYSLQIGCPTITVGPTTLPTGTAGTPFGPVPFTATGAVGATTFAITTDTLPAGITFIAGVLAGETATQYGSFPFIVTVTDSNGCMGTVSDTLTINAAVSTPPAVVNDPETITVTDAQTFPDVADTEKITVTDTDLVRAFNAITITPTPASFNASSGTAYQTYPYTPVPFSATGGIGTLTLTETGALPSGITFTNGTLSGTPAASAAGNTYTFSVTATDADGDQATLLGYTLTVSTSTIPPAVVKDPETITVSDTETFPDIPDTETITVTDIDSVVAFNAITITPTPASFNAADGSAYATAPYTTVPFTASGGIGAFTFTETGNLPPGITLTNGKLSGTPTASAAGNTYTFSVTATDADNDQATVQGYTLTILTKPLPLLTLSANPDSLSIAQGQTGVTTLTFTPSGGYTGTLTLGCLGLPSSSLCVFSLNGTPIDSLTLSGDNQPVTVLLTIKTDVPMLAGLKRAPPSPGSTWQALVLWWPASLLALAAFGRNRKLRHQLSQRQLTLCLLLLTGVLAASLTGCSLELAHYLTPVGTSTVEVTATPSSGTAQSISINVTITR
jgi:hypothetical protein